MTSSRKSISIGSSWPSLVAWLSLCILAAAWGRLLPPMARFAFLNMGSFGIVAAVGLELAARSRVNRCQALQESFAQERVKRELKELTRRKVTIEDWRTAFRRVADDVHERDKKQLGRRGESRLAFQCPARVAPLEESDAWQKDEADVFTAYVRDVSGDGVGLVHNRPVDDRDVMLTFSLASGESVSLAASPVWCSLQADGRHRSGWKLIDAERPAASCSEEMAITR